MYNIESFDERTVLLADNTGAYTLKLSIANLKNGKKVAYAKRSISYNKELYKKIKKTPQMGKSLHKASENSITTDSNKSSRYFIKVEDSEGRKLNEAQQEYFKNSQAVDVNAILDLYSDIDTKGVNYEQQIRLIKDYFGEECFKECTNKDWRSVERYDRPAERNKSRSDAYHAEREQNRRRVYIKDGVVVDDSRKSIKVDDARNSFKTYGEASPYTDSLEEVHVITTMLSSTNSALFLFEHTVADIFKLGYYKQYDKNCFNFKR